MNYYKNHSDNAIGQFNKTIRQALRKDKFAEYQSRLYGKIIVLGRDIFNENGDIFFCPRWYSTLKKAQTRIDKMQAAGIKCSLSERKCGYIIFSGYAEESELALEKERNETAEALKAWNEKQNANQNLLN